MFLSPYPEFDCIRLKSRPFLLRLPLRSEDKARLKSKLSLLILGGFFMIIIAIVVINNGIEKKKITDKNKIVTVLVVESPKDYNNLGRRGGFISCYLMGGYL